ncbi:HNH endonuclease signature motif containing protein [Arthrobacter sp. B3I4]|uniref:HNH endonuclease signature motif containing protein n=1 Tax=Arthrobacter sp. B3I4 TaxID=3042267 RepID=UPI00278B9EC1|nr:HNH endonuclease signature motif containing protein [Arthrobacter sp. B3I4]MDQ0756962.1 hypothetical protein [Arthrobacter sp. B3I4]
MGTSAAVTSSPATRPDADGRCGAGPTAPPLETGPTTPLLDDVLGQLRELTATAAEDTAGLGFRDAAAYAGQIEEAGRALEYLQVMAAGAVDRTRTSAPDAVPAGEDGYRRTEDFLRDRLQISAAEAHRRLSLARTVLPRTGITGGRLPPVHEELADAFAAGDVPTRSATIINQALERVRPLCDAETAARMEHSLTRAAAEHDPDFLSRLARRWVDGIDQDGGEPSEELLRQLQGVFIRRPRHGLQHLEIFATNEQFEHLLTAMNTATNPRNPGPQGSGTGPGTNANTKETAGTGTRDAPAEGTAAQGTAATGVAGAATGGAGTAVAGGAGYAGDRAEQDVFVPGLDWRSRPQKLLDGLVGASKVALASGGMPATGALRPQVMVTIDYRDLLDRLQHTTTNTAAATTATAGTEAWGGADAETGANGFSFGNSGTGTNAGDGNGFTFGNSGTTTNAESGNGSSFGQGFGRVTVQSAEGGNAFSVGQGFGTGAGQNTGQGSAGLSCGGAGPLGFTGTGTLAFTGPVTASTIRKIACDADIIPVLLGSQGRVLDIGRTSRVFPPHIRKALTARDQGCTFPGCTIPASWCEAHHITYWSRGGTTGTDNGTLLCSHHHHLIHKEAWTIQLRSGVPWFIPPPHLDPRQTPRQNHYFRS